MNCKVFPFVTSSSCTEPPNEKRFETYRRKDKILNSTLLYLRSTWSFPFKDECANLMSSSTLGIHGFVDLIFSIKITRIILSGNKKGLFVFTFPVVTVGAVIPVERPSWCSPPHSKAVLPPVVAPSLQAVQDRGWKPHSCSKCRACWLLCPAPLLPFRLAGSFQSASHCAVSVAVAPRDVARRDGCSVLVLLIFKLNLCVRASCLCMLHACIGVRAQLPVTTALMETNAACSEIKHCNRAGSSAVLCHDRALGRRGPTSMFILLPPRYHMGKEWAENTWQLPGRSSAGRALQRWSHCKGLSAELRGLASGLALPWLLGQRGRGTNPNG